MRDEGRVTADVVVRILDGVSPDRIVIPPLALGRAVFDQRQLRRWNIPESRLPPGSDVRYRGPSLWRDYRGEMQSMQYFWEAVAATDAEAATLDPRPYFHTCQPEPLADLFRAAGLGNVVVGSFDLPKEFPDFDDFWLPHTMPGASVAQRYVSGLDDDRKDALRERLRGTLPFAADGSLHLIDRVWAVRGTKPTV